VHVFVALVCIQYADSPAICIVYVLWFSGTPILEIVVLAELLCPISHVQSLSGAAVVKFTISILRAAMHQYESEV